MKGEIDTVAAVVVTWNSRDWISGCLRALRTQTWPVGQIVVVDNHSEDDTVAIVRDKFQDVHLICNDANLGYCGGNNIGVRSTRSRFVLIVNPDVLLAPRFVEESLKAIMTSSRCGAVTGKTYRGWPDGDADVPVGDTQMALDNAGQLVYRDRSSRDIGRGEMDQGQYDVPREIFAPFGGAALYRREMLDDICSGGEIFDELFFAYKEDIDLGWRARLRGWHFIYAPTATGFHARGWASGGGGSMSARRRVPSWIRRHSFKNRYLLLLKNDSLASIMASLPRVLLCEAKRLLFALTVEPHLFLAYASVIALLPSILRKRKLIQRSRTVSDRCIERLLV